MVLSMEEQLGAVDAITQFEKLFFLDRVWTSYLESAREIPAHEIALLDRLTGEMSDLLRAAPDRAMYLDYVVGDHLEEFAGRYEQTLKWRELSNDGTERLRQLADRHGGMVEYCRSGLQSIARSSETELGQLAGKMERIRRGGFTPGDLSAQFMCNLACGCIAGGVVAPPPANSVGIAAGLAILLFLRSKGEEC
jgi:hypothetical protein